MFDDWLDILLRGSYETTIPAIRIASGVLGPCQGSGRLSWQDHQRIRVQAETDNAAQLRGTFTGVVDTPGRLIPHDTYFAATGCTHDGWELTTNPVPRDGYHVRTDSPHVVWDFTTHGFRLARTTQNGRVRILRALLGPPPDSWIRCSETEFRNPCFGFLSFRQDWLFTATSFGRVVARQRSELWFEVKLEIESTPARAEPSHLLTAVARAFSFVLGRRCFVRGHEDLSPDSTTRYVEIASRPPTRSTILQPLGWQMAYLQNVERLLGPCIDFFLTDSGEEVAQHLYVCWDSADNAFATQLAVASIALEGLLRLAAGSPGSGQQSSLAADRDTFETWLDRNPESLTPHFIARLRGFLGMLNQPPRPVDILRSWRARQLLGVNDQDIEAWSRTRNSSAHAALIAPAPNRDELQNRVTRLDRVVNLINRIVLQLIGYTGNYVDYSQPGHPEVSFQAAAPGVLSLHPDGVPNG